ncbi:hypothetical protein GON03_19200 [Nocardioides sp. MAH-18]|uniref:Uncharacterized protein n=1 Tax=Nocardioides agri TaxID=2682843 RepID=A0A6L6XXA4_9ACTN|nr:MULTISPECIES: hypothetical protein [unclassified Nocardioides]MBA2952146.1 hypothetical protein [Nocardioides sp. CGMCC 1.13656]MVQ51313.1 hypothetical protein [Nocardioides sp. MAH-18]
MTAQPALFEGYTPTAKPRRAAASDAVLLVLAEVAVSIDRGYDDGIGAPEVGLRRRTVDAAVERGWLARSYVGDSDTEQGPRRLHLTAAGREQIAFDDAYAVAGGWLSVRQHVTGGGR